MKFIIVSTIVLIYCLSLSNIIFSKEIGSIRGRFNNQRKEKPQKNSEENLLDNLEDELDDLLTLGVSDITTGNPDKLKKRQQNYDKLRKRVEEVMEKDKLRAFQSPVNGEVIMQVCNLQPSKKVGEIKTEIEEAILDGIIGNNYEEAYEYLLKIKDRFI